MREEELTKKQKGQKDFALRGKKIVEKMSKFSKNSFQPKVTNIQFQAIATYRNQFVHKMEEFEKSKGNYLMNLTSYINLLNQPKQYP